MTAISSIKNLETIQLPEADSLEEVWDSLGFVPDEWGNRPISGIYRRLQAAVMSISRRGTNRCEFWQEVWYSCGVQLRSRKFAWESLGGVWGSRHWRVEGVVVIDDDKQTITVKDVTVMVESTACRKEGVSQWTAFTGRALDAFIGDRLGWVLAHWGARILEETDLTPQGWRRVKLTKSEREQWSDLHTHPVAAWKVGRGEARRRVVLEDDDYGSAWLQGTTEEDKFLLCGVALRVAAAPFLTDGDKPQEAHMG